MKRGSSHLEVILSFTIFSLFSFFLIYYLAPTQEKLLESSIIYGLEDNFFKNVTTNYSILLMNSTQICKPPTISEKAIKSNAILSQPFFYIIISSELNGTLQTCSGSYQTGYKEDMKVISNSSVALIKEIYEKDYVSLKNYFNVPANADFAIVSGDYSMEREIPDDIEVQSAVFTRQVVYSNGEMKTQDFIFKIW